MKMYASCCAIEIGARKKTERLSRSAIIQCIEQILFADNKAHDCDVVALCDVLLVGF